MLWLTLILFYNLWMNDPFPCTDWSIISWFYRSDFWIPIICLLSHLVKWSCYISFVLNVCLIEFTLQDQDSLVNAMVHLKGLFLTNTFDDLHTPRINKQKKPRQQQSPATNCATNVSITGSASIWYTSTVDAATRRVNKHQILVQ